MQFSIIALLGLGALAAAAPTPVEAVEVEVEARDLLVERTGNKNVCCPKGKRSKCSPCAPGKTCPKGTDSYKSCSNIGQLGLVNLLLCDILNDNTINVPITVSLLNSA